MKTITLVIVLAIVLLYSCNSPEKEAIKVHCGIYDAYAVTVTSSLGASEEEKEEWAFLHDTLGNVIDVKQVPRGNEITLEDNSGCHSNYHLTVLHYKKESDGKKYFTFKTYINIPSNYVLKQTGGFGKVTSGGPIHLTINGVDTINQVETSPDFYLFPMKIEKDAFIDKYVINNVSWRNQSLFVKIKANNESQFRYVLYKDINAQFYPELNYQALPKVDKELEINMYTEGRWIIRAEGLYGTDYNRRVYLNELNGFGKNGKSVKAAIPNEINQFFVYIQGAPESDINSTVYFKGIFNTTKINLKKDFYYIQVNKNTTDELIIKGVGSGDVVDAIWLDNNSVPDVLWRVIGPFDRTSLIRPAFPPLLLKRFPELNALELKETLGVSAFFYDNIDGYQDYLNTAANGDGFWEFRHNMRQYYRLY